MRGLGIYRGKKNLGILFSDNPFEGLKARFEEIKNQIESSQGLYTPGKISGRNDIEKRKSLKKEIIIKLELGLLEMGTRLQREVWKTFTMRNRARIDEYARKQYSADNHFKSIQQLFNDLNLEFTIDIRKILFFSNLAYHFYKYPLDENHSRVYLFGNDVKSNVYNFLSFALVEETEENIVDFFINDKEALDDNSKSKKIYLQNIKIAAECLYTEHLPKDILDSMPWEIKMRALRDEGLDPDLIMGDSADYRDDNDQ
jgi:hypothetical protein